MPFMDQQAEYLKRVARSTVLRLKEWEGIEVNQIEIIENELREACSMGYAIAMDEVRSTPWEFAISTAGEQWMDKMAANGWEFVSVFGCNHDQVIWRRRKAVGDLPKENTK